MKWANPQQYTNTIIAARGIGKKYRLGNIHEGIGYKTMRDVLVNKLGGLMARRQRTGVTGQTKDSQFWALRDISFDIRCGEVVGIIGRNGAGKSTLLKIFSQITEPTEGELRLRGRVASLLEVGTGFHPELTGRENIFLNGAIMGMTRAEIRRKFNEIAAFSEIEKFLDTPVKRYSSGMYTRLAFAVAAHLDPEILVVDEVLAVGDYKFQEKCLGKMKGMMGEGRTVLFVSHNMKAITEICNRVILLAGGRMEADGNPHSVVQQYLGAGQREVAQATWPADSAPGNRSVRILAVQVRSKEGAPTSDFSHTEPINILVTFLVLNDATDLYLEMSLVNEEGVEILVTRELDRHRFRKGAHEASFTILPHFLNEGKYFVQRVIFHEGLITCPEVAARADYPVGFRVDYSGKFTGGAMEKHPGVVRPDWTWQICERQGSPTASQGMVL